MYGIAKVGKDHLNVISLGKEDSFDACFANANASSKGPFHSVTWHKPGYNGKPNDEYNGQCFGRSKISA